GQAGEEARAAEAHGDKAARRKAGCGEACAEKIDRAEGDAGGASAPRPRSVDTERVCTGANAARSVRAAGEDATAVAAGGAAAADGCARRRRVRRLPARALSRSVPGSLAP